MRIVTMRIDDPWREDRAWLNLVAEHLARQTLSRISFSGDWLLL